MKRRIANKTGLFNPTKKTPQAPARSRPGTKGTRKRRESGDGEMVDADINAFREKYDLVIGKLTEVEYLSQHFKGVNIHSEYIESVYDKMQNLKKMSKALDFETMQEIPNDESEKPIEKSISINSMDEQSNDNSDDETLEMNTIKRLKRNIDRMPDSTRNIGDLRAQRDLYHKDTLKKFVDFEAELRALEKRLPKENMSVRVRTHIEKVTGKKIDDLSEEVPVGMQVSRPYIIELPAHLPLSLKPHSQYVQEKLSKSRSNRKIRTGKNPG
jgi:hypothetical protein